MKRCTITGNTTTSGSCGVQQNAMATGPLALIDSTISNNSCDLSGGGIGQANPNQAVSLTNCTVSGNKAGVNGDGNGGGINCGEGIVNVIGGSITGNSADDGGGIFSTAPDSVILSGVTVSGNSPNQCNANVSC